MSVIESRQLIDETTAVSASETLTEQVTATLGRMLTAGELGEPMPPERQLAQLLNVSRITLRRALADLEAHQIIHREHGRGTYGVGGPAMTSPEALSLEQESVLVVLVQQNSPRFNPQRTPWTWRVCRSMQPLLEQRGYGLRLVNDEAFISTASRGKLDDAPIAGVLLPTHLWPVEQYKEAERFIWPWVGLGRRSLVCFWNILDPDWTGALSEAINDLKPSPNDRVFIPNQPYPDEIDQQLWLETVMRQLSAHGVPRSHIVIKADGPFETHGYLATRWYMREHGRPTLVLSSFDLSIVGAYRALQSQDQSSLNNIRFLGAADLEIAKYLRPQLSTLSVNYTQIAQTILDMLDEQRRTHGPVALRLAAAKYIQRESSTASTRAPLTS